MQSLLIDKSLKTGGLSIAIISSLADYYLIDQGLLDFDGGKVNGENHSGECNSFSFPRAAIEIFSNIKAGIFQTLGVTSLSPAVSLVPTTEDRNESENVSKKEVSETCELCAEANLMSEMPSTKDITPDQDVIKFSEMKDVPFSSSSENSNGFKQFDIIDNCLDHHFMDEQKGLTSSQVSI